MRDSICGGDRPAVREPRPPAGTAAVHKPCRPAGAAAVANRLDSAGWKFDWFRQESVSSPAQLIRTNEPDGVLRVSEGGVYSCKGGRGDPAFYTETSTEITIQETVSIKTTVILQPNWSEIFRGETVTLRCEIQGGGGAQWTYEWRTTRNSPSSSEYRTNSITESDSGDYSCTGRRGYQITGWSDAFRLTVRSDKPRASLSADKTLVPAGGSVALWCSVSSSVGWKFDWFRQESVSSPAQLIRTNELDGVLRVSEGGVYSCRGGRGDPAFYTETSTEVTIQETVSKPTVILQHSWSEIFRGETVTLRCEIQGGGGAQWTYEWRTILLTYYNNLHNSEDRITPADSGRYSCKGTRNYLFTPWSDDLSVTVSDKPRASLSADKTILPAGGSVALRCSVSSSAGWKFDWFRQESVSSPAQLIRTNEPDGVLRVSEGGVYSCRGGRGDPAFYTETSTEVTIQETAPSTPARPSFPVMSIVGPVIGVILIILLLLLWRYRKSKDLNCIRLIQSESSNQTSATNHGGTQTDSPVYSSLLHGDPSLYETIQPIRTSGNDADESQQLKNLNKELEHFRMRERPHRPAESSVYANFNPGQGSPAATYAAV
ncbi:basement membrane-specific heparan sulfate proteoglycan core protein-like [Fundulus heteroclitus]|uniref:basement membrane-specific heparan sulfate proteoglycan core protein-like n=1 Tax=Fundulus heteroclitus TaxID=8078 RepID=UPI00165B6B3F|nr:basement membrane-specific heparan sulfate proteoglycan core protein-like [Fundulus heteroclitus]